MFINKRNILRAAVLLSVALINVLIIQFASGNKPEIYWLLMLSIPLLFFAYCFIMKKKHKPIHDISTANDNSLSFSENLLFSDRLLDYARKMHSYQESCS